MDIKKRALACSKSVKMNSSEIIVKDGTLFTGAFPTVSFLAKRNKDIGGYCLARRVDPVKKILSILVQL